MVAVTAGAASIVKLNTKLAAMLSGGSFAILVGHLCREDRDRASFTCAKSVFGLIVKVVAVTGCDDRVGRVSCSAGGANNLEPVACYVDWLAEGNGDVGIGWLIDRAVGRRGAVTVGAAPSVVVKLKTKFAAMLSGGSIISWSLTCAAKTVTVQVSVAVKSLFGLIVKVVGPPVTTVSATLRVPLVAQTIWNQLPVTLTASLKVMVMSVFCADFVAPFVGVVAVTLGGASTLIVTRAVSFGVNPLVTV